MPRFLKREQNEMATKKDIKFEDAMAGLEAAVHRLESSELTLDESVKEFEEAMKLVKICNERLEKAEQKVRILTEAADGSVSDSDFGAQENEA